MRGKVIISVLFLMLSMCFCASAEGAEYLVKFKDGFFPDMAEYNLTEVIAEEGIYSVAYADLEKIPEEYIEYSAPNETISLIEGEMPVMTYSLGTDEFYSLQWQLQMIKGESCENYKAYGNDIKVAVIDSGCYVHDDLKDNLLPGYNYRDKNTDTTDENGHGTHVSGIIAAQMNEIGISGVAPKAKIVPLKSFGASKQADLEDIVVAIKDAVDKYDCDIINMSWGSTSDNKFLKAAIDHAYSKGAILIAAVGNESSEVLCYPAAYDNVIGVTSISKEKTKSEFSQYNTSITVAAPGEEVPSTYLNGEYRYMWGTSQATPMVSGIAAVALSMDPTMTNAEFMVLVTETAEDLGDEGYDTYFGHGLVNEEALLAKLVKPVEYVISPVNTTAEKAYLLIKNNTEEELKAISILAQYSADGQFIGCKRNGISLLPGEETEVDTERTDSSDVAHFLWGASGDLMPLTDERKSER